MNHADYEFLAEIFIHDKLPNTTKTVKFAVSTIALLLKTASIHNFGHAG